MALAVAGVSLLVILAALAAALFDKETVRESVIRLHELADATSTAHPPTLERSPRGNLTPIAGGKTGARSARRPSAA
jgi:hypothetical protein